MRKRLFATLLALVMALGLTVTATADTDLPNNFDGGTLSAGSYKLEKDWTVSNTIIIDGAVTIDLNGHVLKYANTTTKGSVFKVNAGGHLIINDTGTETTHYFTVDDTDLWTLTDTPTDHSVTGGIITGGTGTEETSSSSTQTAYYYGGSVYLEIPNNTGGALTLNGGTIVGCTADTMGGGVNINSGGSFTMSGGTIADCRDTNTDIGFSGISDGVDNGGTIEAHGGTISSNVYNDGSIERNSAATGTTRFTATVTNVKRIRGGEFTGEVTNSGGESPNYITGGVFYGKVTNNNYITGGAFYGGLTGNGIFATSTINAEDEITISPGYTTYTVKFVPNGGTSAKAIPDQVFVNSESCKAIKPATDPTREGFKFAGWYSGDTEWNFNDAVTGNNTVVTTTKVKYDDNNTVGEASTGILTLTARWVELQPEEEPAAPTHSHTRRQSTTPAATDTTTETTVVTSAKTFDTGVAVYGAMAVASLLGMGYVGKKRV